VSDFAIEIRVGLVNIVGVLDGLSVPVLAAPGKPAIAGGFEPGLARFADGLTSSFVFVVRRHVSNAGVEPDRIPELAGDSEFGAQGGRVLDLEQVRELDRSSPFFGGCVGSALLWPGVFMVSGGRNVGM
jgi:hypothetical protein